MNEFILLCSIVIILCVLVYKFFSKFGVPMLLVFIILGIIFGIDGIFRIDFNNFELSRQACSIALIFIIFFGGFGTKISAAKGIVFKSVLLSTLGVLFTALGVTIVAHYVLDIDITISFLIGAVVSSTDAASVFSILRSFRLNLKEKTAPLLEIESGSNDPMALILTVLALNFIHGGNSIVLLMITQVVFGVSIGVIFAYISIYILKKIKFNETSFSMAFLLGIVSFTFALAELINGNGYLAVYILGIVVGNSKFKNKVEIVHFFDGITSVLQMLVFFLIGLLINPRDAYEQLMPAIIISIFMMFIIRPIVVFVLTSFGKSSIAQRLLVSWCGLRGASAIVFAMVAMNYSDSYILIFNISFIIVILSISIQGSTIPKVSKMLNMIDTKEDVLKTFNDYSNEEDVDFITFTIRENHEWIGKKLKDIKLMPSVLLVLIIRNGENIIPNGSTIIKFNDEIVLCGASYTDTKNKLELNEMKIDDDSDYVGKAIRDIDNLDNKLIIMIKRNDKSMIPHGYSKIKPNDTLVLLER